MNKDRSERCLWLQRNSSDASTVVLSPGREGQAHWSDVAVGPAVIGSRLTSKALVRAAARDAARRSEDCRFRSCSFSSVGTANAASRTVAVTTWAETVFKNSEGASVLCELRTSSRQRIESETRLR